MKYFIATRPYVVSASLIPFTIGAFLSIHSGHFVVLTYIIAALSLMFIHFGSNSANDYFDYKNNIDRPGTFGSGGSRLLIRGKITVQEERWVMITCFILSVFFGMIVVLIAGLPILWFGIAGILGGYFYTAKPISLKYHGFSVPSIFIIYGILTTLGGQYLMAHTLTLTGLIFSIIIGLPVTNIVLANEIRDTENDKIVGIKSLTILFGEITGVWLYIMIFLLQYILLSYEIMVKNLSMWVLLAFVAIPIYLFVIVKLFSKVHGKLKAKDIANADFLSSMGQLLFGLSIIIGLSIR
jgi:1,4-dihydroxy-2-naphthoate octaprenyltransferase|uniref:Prenyltransferase n=1 Tax=Mesoaciditoga lauensis TaxID=1495039 RepID=A0A7V3RFF9_9BACT